MIPSSISNGPFGLSKNVLAPLGKRRSDIVAYLADHEDTAIAAY